MPSMRPGDRVKTVQHMLTPGGFPKTVTHTGEYLGIDPEDSDRALVRYDGYGGHISHPLLTIIERVAWPNPYTTA